jgi:hypothetical protein
MSHFATVESDACGGLRCGHCSQDSRFQMLMRPGLACYDKTAFIASCSPPRTPTGKPAGQPVYRSFRISRSRCAGTRSRRR